ncbi:MAG: phosphate signaling complex protein PhoU [Candidatus Accumulibacter sp.]|jgi:phosphate transport system protein|nr:phosphate signaling complex protein PhoU [Accumulibacter sp.]
MREGYKKQLEALHTGIIRMGALCEDAIECAAKGLIGESRPYREKALKLKSGIEASKHEIEEICIRLLLREQPVASDLRQITSAQMIVTDMERIGDQAANIAKISSYMVGSSVKSDIHIEDMSRATLKMLSDSVDAFVAGDLAKARSVIVYDDVVDDLFARIRSGLIAIVSNDSAKGEACFNLLMISKYLERIGDHSANIAEWVVYSITGKRKRFQDDLRSGG